MGSSDKARGALIEPLESRRLYAYTVSPLTAEPAAPFIAKVNFQPASATTYTGYAVDSGATYGARGNGLTYGWAANNNKPRDRNSSASPDQRYDTLATMSSTQSWSIAVPNGRYVVKLIAGDASFYDSVYRIDAEGERIIDYTPKTSSRWATGMVTVDVSDGALTLRGAAGAVNNKVCFVEVYQSDLPTKVTIGPADMAGFRRSEKADFLLRPSGSMSGVSKVEFYANGAKIGEDTSAPFGLHFKNVDVGVYQVSTVVTSTSGARTPSLNVPLTVRPSIVGWLNIGGSYPDSTRRGVGWNIKEEGWRGFVSTHVAPQLAWGVRRYVLSNPFGTLPNENMQMDQYLHAKAAGLTWLTNGFVEAWRPVTANGAEVICYIGSPDGDRDFNITNWQQRFWDSVQPAINAGMAIGLDAAVVNVAGSKTHQAAQMLRNIGVKVYVEARPLITQPHWLDYDVICTDQYWERSDPTHYADSARWAAPASMVRGEIIRAVTEPPFGKNWADTNWVAPHARNILQDGHSVALTISELIRYGVYVQELLV